MAEQRVSLVLSVTGQRAFDKATNSINKVEQAANKIRPTGGKVGGVFRGMGAAANAAKPAISGLGAALTAALGPLAAITTAAALVGKALNTAFERNAAEQKLRNFTDSTAEYEAALAVAAQTAQKFGMSQTEATAALADTYGRLKGLGFGLKETSELYNGFQTIVMQSGTTAEDAAGAFLQLSQALGSGKLQGDELRSILERMPQLAQRIADSMGVSASEIRKLGQEGKLTSQVIYKALKEAGDSAGEFGSTLNRQQQAMKGLGAAADNAFNMIGQALSPAVVATAEALSWAIEKMTDWWDYLAANVMPKLEAALKPVVDAFQDAFTAEDIEYTVNIIQNYLLKVLNETIFVVGKVGEAVAYVATQFQQIADSPAFYIQKQAIGFVLDRLGLTVQTVDEWKAEQEKITAETAKTAENFSSLPEQARDLAKAAKEVTAAIKQSNTELDKTQKAAEVIAKSTFDLGQQRLKTEMAINDVLLDQAKRQLDGAKTAGQREAAAKRIYKLTVQQADLEKTMAKAAVLESVRKVEMQVKYLELKAKEVETIVTLAEAQGTANDSHFKALELARDAVHAAADQLKVQQQIAKSRLEEVDAIYKGKVEAAKAAYEQNRVFEATQKAASAAGSFGAAMSTAAGQTERAATAMEKLSRAQSAASAAAVDTGKRTASFTLEGSAEDIQAGLAMSKWGKQVNGTWYPDLEYIGHASRNGDAFREMQESVDNAAVERGFYEEMVQRSEQQQAAMQQQQAQWNQQNWAASQQRDAQRRQQQALIRQREQQALQSHFANTTINYGGTTMSFNGTHWVTKDDVNGIVNTAVNASIGRMTSSASTRLSLGLV